VPTGPPWDYQVRHTFALRPAGNAAPVVTLVHKEFASARTNSCRDRNTVSGTAAIGMGLTTLRLTAQGGSSNAEAITESNISALGPGLVAGFVEVRGNARPIINGCPPPTPPRGAAWAEARSTGRVRARGQRVDAAGTVTWAGGWVNTSNTVSGSSVRRLLKDPVRARMIDTATGGVTEHTMLSIRSAVGGGETGWNNGMLWNTATDMLLDINISSAVTTQQGRLRVGAMNGFVTESIATGMFTGFAVPPVGAPSGFGVPLPPITLAYALPAGPNDVPEFDLDGGGQTGEGANSLAENGVLITDLGTGAGGADLSELPSGDEVLGFSTEVTASHIADDFVVPAGPPLALEALAWPLYEVGGSPSAPISAAYVRIWQGPPGAGGVLVAGDMVTNRVLDTQPADLYRVAEDASDATRPVKEVLVDLSWVPPLPPAWYWIELATRGPVDVPTIVYAPPGVWRTAADNAMVLNAPSGQWMPARDTRSLRVVDFPFRLYGATQTPCYANCDGSTAAPVLNVADFTCFLQRYANGDPYANCDGSATAPVLNVADFTCFLQRYANGCP
jgi:hypothetical protein